MIKIGLICGVLNNSSIAWKIAEVFLENNWKLILTYQNESFLKKLEYFTKNPNVIAIQCDVSDQNSIDNLFLEVEEQFNSIDFLVHSIAFADKNELQGDYFNTSRENFLNSMNISCFSLTALVNKFHTIMPEKSSFLTLTYYGAEKVIPNYNVMGLCKAALECSVKYLAVDLGKKNIRINAISAGIIKTLAARGIGNLKNIHDFTTENSPIARPVETSEVAKTALFLCDDGSTGITGEIIHVDCGYSCMGAPNFNNAN